MLKQKPPGIKTSHNTIAYFKRKLAEYEYRNEKIFPWRKTRIKFHALVAEILLQRTKAEQVIPVYNKFVIKYPAADVLASSPLSMINRIIAPLGLKWRAKKLKIMSTVLSRHYLGNIPIDMDKLIALPGVGPYSASAYLSLHNNIRALLIDSNTVRLYGRYFGFEYDNETRRKGALVELADKLTPHYEFRKYNYTILDLGRNICKTKPSCSVCPVLYKCHYYNQKKEKT